MLRRIFEPNRNQVTNYCRQLRKDKLYNFEEYHLLGYNATLSVECILYSLPDILRVIKPVTVRWERRALRLGKVRNTYEVFVVKISRKETTLQTKA
jgi:hypothetical protein